MGKERTPKVAKGRVERMFREYCEKHGYTFLYVNWAKEKAHYVTDKGVHKTEQVRYA